MKISVSEDLDINEEKVELVIEKLSKYVGMDATLEIGSYYEPSITVDYAREETGPERSKRVHKELGQSQISKRDREIQYLKLKKEFG